MTTDTLSAPASLPGRVTREVFLCAFPTRGVIPAPKGATLFGRQDVPGHSSKVSEQHAQFTKPSGQLHVQYPPNKIPKNKIFVDGWELEPGEVAAVYDGTILRLGDTILVYREAFSGEDKPMEPLGQMVGPFGLWDVCFQLNGLKQVTAQSVLLQGETGSGKELLAAHVAATLRGGKPHESINVAAIPPTVIASELFGHRKGAFTGATQDRAGIFERNTGGTVFVDEFGYMPKELQPLFLRLLSPGEVQPLGAKGTKKVDVLTLFGTSGDLTEMLTSGRLAQDLYFRVQQPQIRLPPLRERVEDLWALAEHLAPSSGARLDPTKVEPQAIERLMLHGWEGNVRTLEKVLVVAGTLVPRPALTLAAVKRALDPEPADCNDPAPTPPSLTRAGMKGMRVKKLSEARMIDELLRGRHDERSRNAVRGRLLRFLDRNPLPTK